MDLDPQYCFKYSGLQNRIQITKDPSKSCPKLIIIVNTGSHIKSFLIEPSLVDPNPLYSDPDPHYKVTNRTTDPHMNIETTYSSNSAVYCQSLFDLNIPTTFVQAGYIIK